VQIPGQARGRRRARGRRILGGIGHDTNVAWRAAGFDAASQTPLVRATNLAAGGNLGSTAAGFLGSCSSGP